MEIHPDKIRPKTTIDLGHLPKVQGHTYEEPFTVERLLEGYKGVGFQGSNLAKAIEVINIMRREKAYIFLGFTSNMVSSGLRESITYLCKHRLVDFIVTQTGGVDEDLLKCWDTFKVGSFEAQGKFLLDHGVARIGNLFVENNQFINLDRFLMGVLQQLHAEYTEQGKTPSTIDVTRALGHAIDNEESYLYWAAKHDIPVVMPAPTDGSFGDITHYFRQQHKEFRIDATGDHDRTVHEALNNEKVGAIFLGAGVVKHYILNANIFREGVDYAVYINTSEGFDGSDSGGNIEEAITWSKVKAETPHVKVHCDATIAWPLIMAGTFAP